MTRLVGLFLPLRVQGACATAIQVVLGTFVELSLPMISFSLTSDGYGNSLASDLRIRLRLREE